MVPPPEILNHVLAGPQGKCHNGNRTRLVCGEGKDTRVTNVEICHIMTLGEAVCHEFLRVIAKLARTGLVQALPRWKRVISGSLHFSFCRFN